MNQLKVNLYMIAATMILFVAALAVNELLFAWLEFAAGINWIYLPAGVRLLSVLLFAEAGALGLLVISWGVCFLYFFPNDPVRSLVGGLLASAAPYLVYLVAQKFFGLRANLANLSPLRLFYCAIGFAIASPLLHHLWFAWYEQQSGLVSSFIVMFIGDLTGTIIVLYSAKALLQRTSVSEGYAS